MSYQNVINSYIGVSLDVFYLFLSANENSAATFQNPFGGALHDKQMAGVARVITLVNRDLVLVG